MTAATGGHDGISQLNDGSCWEGRINLGPDATGRRLRRKVRGSTRAEVRAKLDRLVANHTAKPRSAGPHSAPDTGQAQS